MTTELVTEIKECKEVAAIRKRMSIAEEWLNEFNEVMHKRPYLDHDEITVHAYTLALTMNELVSFFLTKKYEELRTLKDTIK